MCTVTWAASATGYRLFMNRDERFTRGSAEPPGVHRDTTVQYLSPTDSDAGGTWIAANEHGLTVCLLNHYPAEPCGPGGERTGYRSRGHLVRDLIPARSAAEVSAAIRRMELARYRPFTLLAMCARARPVVHQWDGCGALESTEGPDRPMASSSFDSEAVIAARRDAYRRLVGDDPSPERLEAYHRSHLPSRGAYSVCVHRDDGGTRSLTVVEVDSGRVTMTYHDGPPCEDGEVTTRALARRVVPDYHPGA